VAKNRTPTASRLSLGTVVAKTRTPTASKLSLGTVVAKTTDTNCVKAQPWLSQDFQETIKKPTKIHSIIIPTKTYTIKENDIPPAFFHGLWRQE